MASQALSEIRSSVVWAAAFLLVGLVLSACAPRRPPAPPAGRLGATPTSTRPRPAARATVALEEKPIGEAPEITPPPTATPATEAAATTLPTPTAEVEATGPEPESLLKVIGPATPPNVAAALRLIEDGRQQVQQGAYDAALDRLERAVAIDPTNAYGYYFLARVHLLKKDYDQAIAFASRAASLTAHTDRVFLGRIRSLEGAAFEEVGRYPDARKAYQQAVEADPNNLAAKVGLTRLSSGE
jgi:predicted negative regulator of RcsB-dependent stress response